jgi:glycerol uptake facilitator-like aquaporin
MSKGRVQGVTYTRDRIIVGFFHTSFKGFFTIVLVAGGAGAQVDEAGSAGVAMAAASTDGDRAVSVEGVSGPDAGPATAIVTSSARDGAGFTPSASVGLASSASFPVRGVSATFWCWGLGKEDDGLQSRVVINISTNQLDTFII